MTFSQRLRHARQAMNLTLIDVEERTEIGSTSLSDFENGKREPKLAQLKQLAHTYRRPIHFFLDENDLTSEIVLWRKKPTSPKVEEIRGELLNLAEQYHNLEVWCDDLQPMELSFATGDKDTFSYPKAEKLAAEFRNKYCLGDRPGQTLVRVLEEVCKVKVFHLSFEPTGSAACTFSDRYGAAVLLNSHNIRWRRNFDLAHELFHLLTWKIFRQGDSGEEVEPSDQEERLATCFARNLLMPQEALKCAVESQRGERKKLTFDDLFEVARQFDVSVEALLRHMGFVYGIPKERIQTTVEQLRPQMSFWDERERDAPPSRPLRFHALARQALRRGEIAAGRYAQYVGISRREAANLVEQDVENDAEFEIADF